MVYQKHEALYYKATALSKKKKRLLLYADKTTSLLAVKISEPANFSCVISGYQPKQKISRLDKKGQKAEKIKKEREGGS